MSDYNYQNLHKRAAEYFKAKRVSQPNSIEDLEPQLLEFDHLLVAKEYDAATLLINDVGQNYLSLWGFLSRIVDMRSQLIGRVENLPLSIDNLLFLADTYRMMGRITEATETCKEALKIAEEAADNIRACRAHCTLGGIYRKAGLYDSAIHNLKTAIMLSEELNERDVLLQASLQLGQILYYNGKVEEAQTNLQNAVTVAREDNNRRMEGDLLGQLGYAALWLGHTNKATAFFKSALKIVYEINNTRGKGYWHLGLGETFLSVLELADSQENFLSAIRIAEEIPDSHLLSYARSFLAQVKLHEGSLDEALRNIQFAREIDNPPHNDFKAMLHGVILARLGEKDSAMQALRDASDHSSKILTRNPDLLEAKGVLGLIHTVMALLLPAEEDKISHLTSAQRTFKDAFQETVAEGVIKRVVNIAKELSLIDKHNAIQLIADAMQSSLKDILDKTGVYIELHIDDFKTAIDFYSNLGFVVVFRTEDDGGYLTLRKERCILNFYGGSEIINEHDFFSRFPSSTQPGYRVEIVVIVRDVQAAFRAIKDTIPKKHIVETLQKRPWGQMDFRLVDPFGFYLRFTETIDWLHA